MSCSGSIDKVMYGQTSPIHNFLKKYSPKTTITSLFGQYIDKNDFSSITPLYNKHKSVVSMVTAPRRLHITFITMYLLFINKLKRE